MKKYRLEGVIIKKRNFKEADKIITVFTKDYGKVSVLAKGVRKINSRRGPSLELFNHTTLLVHESSFLGIITEASVYNSFEHIKKDLSRITRAYQACELIDCLTREDQENSDAFFLLLAFLDQINSHEPVNMDQFKRQLLAILGFLSEADVLSDELDSFIETIAERKLATPRIYE